MKVHKQKFVLVKKKNGIFWNSATLYVISLSHN